MGTPWLSIRPETVPWSREPGVASVTWSSGGAGGPWEVRVSQDGADELVFATAAAGTQDAPWVRAGSAYAFRLYPPRADGRAVAACTVRMGSAPRSVRSRAYLKAEPSRVTNSAQPGKTTLTWDTGDGADGVLVLAVKTLAGQREQVVTSGPSGRIELDWIDRDVLYRFRLYRRGDRRRAVAATSVSMGFRRLEVLLDVAILGVLVAAGSIAVIGVGWIARRVLLPTVLDALGRLLAVARPRRER